MSFAKDDILRLAEIVREETGNDVQPKNYPMLESRIRSHMLKIGIETAAEYWAHFALNEVKERALIQSLMTTHYTFFFREFAHFEVLQNWIDTEVDRIKKRFAQTKLPVKVWCAACSRGQEVYSLAMFLEINLFNKHGIPFEILGTDIDPESVNYARNGVYPIKEVNTIPQIYVGNYWKKGTGAVKEYAAVHSNLKSRARFETLNLLEIPQWPNKESFDVIFCRNVFIYFSQQNVKTIAIELSKKLDGLGLLISGMSEPLRFEGWSFQSVGPSCYRRQISERQEPAVAQTTPVSRSVVVETPKEAPSKKYRVLCVDDSVTIQMLIKKIFAHDPNCEVVETAINGLEARKKLDAGKFDIITLDIHMPEMNGIEFLEKAYDRKNDPPVLMISSVNRTDVELATKSMSLGAFDYVEKPAMNNLAKSLDEILTKTKMALRWKNSVQTTTVTDFDKSIGQKIVVPDASQCMRLVLAAENSISILEQVVRGQKDEYRSPALVIRWRGNGDTAALESNLMKWSDRPVHRVRQEKKLYRPNSIYIVDENADGKIFDQQMMKSVSLQVLDKQEFLKDQFASTIAVQVLVDESFADYSKSFEHQSGFKVSDVTPATSFPSLSVEFFANLRRAA